MKNLVYLFALLFCFSCSEVSEPMEACATDNVLTDLPWLIDLIENEENGFIGKNYSYISTGIYKSKRIFILSNCCPNCLMLPPPVYDCSGNMLGRVGDDDFESDKIKDEEVIWKSSENSCTVKVGND